MKQFEAELYRPEGTGTWTYFKVPFRADEVFGSKSQIKVKGTVNGIAYRSTLMPSGDGSYYMVVKQAIREAAGVTAGDPVRVTMEPDTEARTVEVPEDLAAMLKEHPEAAERFERMSYSHQREYTEWIESAKKPETRANRIAKAMAMLAEGKRLKG